MKKLFIWNRSNQAGYRWPDFMIHLVIFTLGILVGVVFVKLFVHFC
jgi:hypothetical protein